MKNCFALIVLLCVAFSCQQDAKAALKPLNLLKYGIPIEIMAPDSAKVKSSSLGFAKDITVKHGKNYNVQIIATDATSTDVQKIKADQLQQVKENPYFSKLVKEEDTGFIYETVIDSTYTNYGFKYIRVQGDMEFIFQTGMSGKFSQEDVKKMYESVQPTK